MNSIKINDTNTNENNENNILQNEEILRNDILLKFFNKSIELQRTKYVDKSYFFSWVRNLEEKFNAKRKGDSWNIFVFPAFGVLNYVASYRNSDAEFEKDVKNILKEGFKDEEIEKLRKLYEEAKSIARMIKCLEYGQNCVHIVIDGNYVYAFSNETVLQKLEYYLQKDQMEGGFIITVRRYDPEAERFYEEKYERYVKRGPCIKIMRGTLPRLLKILEMLNINYNKDEIVFTKNISIENVPENLLKILRDYQIRAVNKAIESIKKFGVATIMAATGSGKTEMGIALAKALSPTPDAPILIIAPTRDLVIQWRDRLKKYGITDVGVITGDIYEVPANASIFITTPDMPYLTVKLMDKETFNTVFSDLVEKEPNLYETILEEIKMIEEMERGTEEEEEEMNNQNTQVGSTEAILKDERKINILAILRKAKGIIFDEAHHLPARKVNLTARVTPHAVRIGLSATPWRNDKLDLIIYESAGEIVDRVTSSELIEKNYLVPAIIIRFHTHVKSLDNPMLRSRYNYQKEKKAILFDKDRQKLVAEISKIVPWPVLILTGELKPGEELLKELKALGLRASIVHGKLKTYERENILKLFERTAKEISTIYEEIKKLGYDPSDISNEGLNKILTSREKEKGIPFITHLIGTTLADEGLDIPALRSLILYFPGKSSTRVFQRIGRSLRIAPEKHFSIVVDLVDVNSKYFSSHASRRRELYNEERKWKVIDVKTLDELSQEIEEISRKTREELLRDMEKEEETKKKLLEEGWKEIEIDKPLIIVTPTDPPDLRRPIYYKTEEDENYEKHIFRSIKSGEQVVIYRKKNKLKQFV